MAAAFPLRGRCALAASALAVAVTASGCGGADFSPQDWDAPGRNARVGDLVIRNAHLAEPRDGTPWQRGDDVPAYVWLYNKGAEADELVGAGTPVAASVDLVGPDGTPLPGGVELPANTLVALEPGKRHLVLRDVRDVIRGGDFLTFTLRFRDAGPLTFTVQAQLPDHDEAPSRKQ